jgi:hypothetical protein
MSLKSCRGPGSVVHWGSQRVCGRVWATGMLLGIACPDKHTRGREKLPNTTSTAQGTTDPDWVPGKVVWVKVGGFGRSRWEGQGRRIWVLPR